MYSKKSDAITKDDDDEASRAILFTELWEYNNTYLTIYIYLMYICIVLGKDNKVTFWIQNISKMRF